ncbi:cyclase family protein [Streptomyces sp. NPDC020951]|uniref:cyclase family protein n=1 Tax=Streptomyces sp. NPDC020951 TaxID=3365104 RepID=UPI0037B96028
MSEQRTALTGTALTGLVDTFERSAVFELEHPRYVGAPIYPAHWPGFVYTLHRHHEAVGAGVRTSASGTITMQEHSGTHIDALCHQAVEMQMFGGVAVTPEVQTPRGFTQLGAETIAPIFRRGILLDVPAATGVKTLGPGYLVTADDLALAERTQGVVVGEGDCVLIRTGTGSSYSDPESYLAGAGVGPDAARWLAARKPYLCGADNVAFDVPEFNDPELGALPCHVVLIYEAGIYIVENLQLEDLAASGNHEFLFVCLPLKLEGVTGSPVRPVALVLP